MHRLFIDIPLTLSTENATAATNEILKILSKDLSVFAKFGIEKINYRLGHDEDRQRSNYMILDNSGHVSNKKSVIDVVVDNSSGV